MGIAALVTWVITAGFGLFMLIRWASRGGMRRVAGAGTHFPPARVFTHFGLAAAGLVVWIVYLVTDSSVLAWIAVGALVLVAVLGSLLVRRWASDGRAAMRGEAADSGLDLAEQHIPRGPVVVHGIFAVSTLVLALLTALGIGEG
jgi:predicted lysophospholipase L1 biosynthesis ABC-type transport system permease subunit